MKLKEVCERTGLREGTIRLYVAEGLVNPLLSYSNGIGELVFTEQDIEELMTAITLRKLGFTIDEINVMKERPYRIPEMIHSFKQRMEVEGESKAAIVQALSHMDIDLLKNIKTFADLMQIVADQYSLPSLDLSPPNFGILDNVSDEELVEEYKNYTMQQNQQYNRGKTIVFVIACIEVAAGIISFFIEFALFSLIIRIALAAALFAGVALVRYLFICSAAFHAFIIFNLLMVASADLPPYLVVLLILNLIYSIVAGYLLLKNEAVKEFLYTQKNG